jgi:hypothetical protein
LYNTHRHTIATGILKIRSLCRLDLYACTDYFPYVCLMDIDSITTWMVAEHGDTISGGQDIGLDGIENCRTLPYLLGIGKEVFTNTQVQQFNAAVSSSTEGNLLRTFLGAQEKLHLLVEYHLNGRAHYNTL